MKDGELGRWHGCDQDRILRPATRPANNCVFRATLQPSLIFQQFEEKGDSRPWHGILPTMLKKTFISSIVVRHTVSYLEL